jgi:hypothetical protein
LKQRTGNPKVRLLVCKLTLESSKTKELTYNACEEYGDAEK